MMKLMTIQPRLNQIKFHDFAMLSNMILASRNISRKFSKIEHFTCIKWFDCWWNLFNKLFNWHAWKLECFSYFILITYEYLLDDMISMMDTCLWLQENLHHINLLTGYLWYHNPSLNCSCDLSHNFFCQQQLRGFADGPLFHSGISFAVFLNYVVLCGN